MKKNKMSLRPDLMCEFLRLTVHRLVDDLQNWQTEGAYGDKARPI